MVGPTLGYLIASYALEIYVDPFLTPVINSKDQRWIGAWWLGKNPMLVFCALLPCVIAVYFKIQA
jgi:Organic Anion Transporter Polypeptide (OATP) family